MLSRQGRLRYSQRHHVLKLIAKAVCTAGLIECGSGPHAAGESLIEQPAVEHDVHGTIGGFHLNRAEEVVPEARHRGEYGAEVGGSVFRVQRKRLPLRRRLTGEENDFRPTVWLAFGAGLPGAGAVPTVADLTGGRV